MTEDTRHADDGWGPRITQAWEDKAAWLFQNIPAWEDEYDQPQVVCVTHKRFIPCRSCMYSEVATVPYSANPLDVRIVRDHQQGTHNDGDGRG